MKRHAVPRRRAVRVRGRRRQGATVLPLPRDSQWRKLCELWGFSSPRDIKASIAVWDQDRPEREFANRLDPGYADRLATLDAEARERARREYSMTLTEAVLPPNAPEELRVVAKLIQENYLRLSRWYVLELIQQVHRWSFNGKPPQRAQARRIAREIGDAVTVSAGRGRPPKLQANEATAQAALLENDSILERIWPPRFSKKTSELAARLRAEFGDDLTLRVFGKSVENWLQSACASRRNALIKLTQAKVGVTRRWLEMLIARQH
jgi:hypothetical protein